MVSFWPCDALKGTRVLVVEDHTDSRELVKAILEHCGADVTAADSARNALQAFQLHPVDVVVSDIAMPGEDGYWLIGELHRRAPRDRVPAIAMTAFTSRYHRERTLAEGFQGYVSKPLEPDKLCRAIVSARRPKLGALGGSNPLERDAA